MKVAAIDVGTNSFHLLIARIGVEGGIEIVDRAKNMVRLGESAFGEGGSGVISPDAFARGAQALMGFKEIAERHGCDAVTAVATSAVREACNGGEFARFMRDETGIELRVISGEEEAHLIYLGARASLDFGGRRALIVDIGGGSVELIVGDAQKSYHAASLKLGVLRLLAERVTTDPISPDERARLAAHCQRVLDQAALPLRRIGFDQVVMTSGTAHAVADLIATRHGGQSPLLAPSPARKVSFADVLALEEDVCRRTAAERATLPLHPGRVSSIVPGVILVRSLLEVLHTDEMTLCETALREGLVADYVERNRPGIQLVDEFPDLRRRSVVGLCRRYGYHRGHAEHVARLGLALFRGTRALHGLSNADGEMFEFAALLHEIGYHVAARSHHKHGAYLISHTHIQGFSRHEVDLLAQVVRYHRKATPSNDHRAYHRLPRELRSKIRVFSAILRVACGLDRSYGQRVRELRCEISAKAITLHLTVAGEVELEMWGARRKCDLLEEEMRRKVRLQLHAAPVEEVAE